MMLKGRKFQMDDMKVDKERVKRATAPGQQPPSPITALAQFANVEGLDDSGEIEAESEREEALCKFKEFVKYAQDVNFGNRGEARNFDPSQTHKKMGMEWLKRLAELQE